MLKIIEVAHPAEKSLFVDYVKEIPNFKRLVEPFLKPDTMGQITLDFYNFVKAYLPTCFKAYTDNAKIIHTYNDEFILYDWFDAATGEEYSEPKCGMLFKEWITAQGGCVALEYVAIMVLGVYAEVYGMETTVFFDYGGNDEWYRVFIKNSTTGHFEAYYVTVLSCP